MATSFIAVESEHRSPFVPMEITGLVRLVEEATVLVSPHTRLDRLNFAGPCDSRTGRVTFKQHGGKVEDGKRTPNIIPVVVCSRCDAKAFPHA